MTVTFGTTRVATVSEFSARIVRAVRSVGGGDVEGEVQKPRTTPGGMLVFDLTDGTAKLSCKVFPRQVRDLEHQPRHGDLVRVRIDRPDFWVQAGKLDVIVSAISLAGEGELLRRRERLLAQLKSEGLCEPARRKPLPSFPRAVGVIAGKGSVGLRDVLAALQHRFPPVDIVTCPAIVQGARAPFDLIDALVRLDQHPLVDVIVVARGGGSVQDLVAFDDERLCRAVFACRTPVIAAIGHTDNVPVCNHVTWASETPSRSAELAVPAADGLRQQLELAGAKLGPWPERLSSLAHRVESVAVDAGGRLNAKERDVAAAGARLQDAEARFFSERASGLAHAREALAAVPGRVPDAADIEALAGRLDREALTFFAQRTDRVREVADFGSGVRTVLAGHSERLRESVHSLDRVDSALAQHQRSVDAAALTKHEVLAQLAGRGGRTTEQGQRLTLGIRKELSDHVRDYGRAFTRHGDALHQAALKSVAGAQEQVASTAARVDDASARRLANARQALEHVRDLLAASDPRRRGWVLPTDSAGSVVRSVHRLRVGHHLSLSFHDGTAGAVVQTIPIQEEQ